MLHTVVDAELEPAKPSPYKLAITVVTVQLSFISVFLAGQQQSRLTL